MYISCFLHASIQRDSYPKSGILVKTNTSTCNFYNLSWQRMITIELKNLDKKNFKMFIQWDLFQEGYYCVPYNIGWRILWLFQIGHRKGTKKGTS